MFVTIITLSAIVFAIATGIAARRGGGLITPRPYGGEHAPDGQHPADL